MTVTVLDNKDLIAHLTGAEVAMRPEVAADNAKQQAALEVKEPEKGKAPEVKADPPKKDDATDDVEDAEGLTPRQKRELSATMLKAIGKKHREMREAEEFAAAQYNNRRMAEQESQTLRDELAKLKQPAKVEEAKEPVRTNYASDAEYANALIDYRVDQKLKQKKDEEAQERAQAEQAAVLAAAEGRLAKARELVADFDEVTEKDLGIPGHIAGYMQRSAMFAELAYHFGQHPEVIAELRKLHPAEALVELGAIKSTLRPFSAQPEKVNGHEPSAESKPNGVQPSTTGDSPSKPRGTAPVFAPLTSGSTSQVEKPPEQRNIREEIQAWQKKEGRNLNVRRRH